MALNIKHTEVEKLASEAALLAHETKTEAIRKALKERVARLKIHKAGQSRQERVEAVLARVRTEFPKGDFGRRMSKAEKEEILGYGPGGV